MNKPKTINSYDDGDLNNAHYGGLNEISNVPLNPSAHLISFQEFPLFHATSYNDHFHGSGVDNAPYS
jgi:hypothetical protein